MPPKKKSKGARDNENKHSGNGNGSSKGDTHRPKGGSNSAFIDMAHGQGRGAPKKSGLESDPSFLVYDSPNIKTPRI
jgi:hypothetical protein